MNKKQRAATRTASVARVNRPLDSFPEFAGLKKASEISGVGRGLIYKGLAAGKFKSVLLREPGAKNGRRLIHVPSLLAYLHDLVIVGIEEDRSQRGAELRNRVHRNSRQIGADQGGAQ